MVTCVPGKSFCTALATTWAASWRMVSSASGVFEVRISSFPFSVSVRVRSTSLPLNFARTAALARPGPMDSLTKSPTRMPVGAALVLPSGRVIWMESAMGGGIPTKNGTVAPLGPLELAAERGGGRDPCPLRRDENCLGAAGHAGWGGLRVLARCPLRARETLRKLWRKRVQYPGRRWPRCFAHRGSGWNMEGHNRVQMAVRPPDGEDVSVLLGSEGAVGAPGGHRCPGRGCLRGHPLGPRRRFPRHGCGVRVRFEGGSRLSHRADRSPVLRGRDHQRPEQGSSIQRSAAWN